MGRVVVQDVAVAMGPEPPSNRPQGSAGLRRAPQGSGGRRFQVSWRVVFLWIRSRTRPPNTFIGSGVVLSQCNCSIEMRTEHGGLKRGRRTEEAPNPFCGGAPVPVE